MADKDAGRTSGKDASDARHITHLSHDSHSSVCALRSGVGEKEVSFVESLNKMAHGSAYSALPIQRLNEHRIFLPSPADQEVIVATLDSLDEETQRLARLYERKLAALEALKKSLLHQAFTGAL